MRDPGGPVGEPAGRAWFLGLAGGDRRGRQPAPGVLNTAGEHRPDGSYAVERRGADGGQRHGVRLLRAVEAIYERLPDEFDAEAVGREGITGSRRHLLVRHFAEHPAFDCWIESKSPLRAGKRDVLGEVTADAAAD